VVLGKLKFYVEKSRQIYGKKMDNYVERKIEK
jgi:hypothetical protein